MSLMVTGPVVWSCAGQAQHLGDHVAERHRGPDLMISHLAQQRLDRRQII